MLLNHVQVIIPVQGPGLRFHPMACKSGGTAEFPFDCMEVLAFAPVAAAILLKTTDFTRAAERYIGALLLFSPSNHAWYFVWLVPFAVGSRNLGIRLLSLSGFTHFWIWQTASQTGEWTQAPLERILLWGPFVIGFLAHVRKLLRRQKLKKAAALEAE